MILLHLLNFFPLQLDIKYENIILIFFFKNRFCDHDKF